MSDFDKEAEREKLREQFERDEERRVATQRMSELLLRGATMTNRHCETCGDPIFRYEETEFCPTCSAVDGESIPKRDQSTGGELENSAEPAPAAPTEQDVDRQEPRSASGPVEGPIEELRRTIEVFARRARECDDPRRALDNLEVARTAAECLEHLIRTE